MTTHSGLEGHCKNLECEHAMDIHDQQDCPAWDCDFEWLRCTAPGHCNGTHYRVCAQCPDHPAAWPVGWEKTSNKVVKKAKQPAKKKALEKKKAPEKKAAEKKKAPPQKKN